jgi:N-acetylmuramoyl-L-alanine amidase
MAALTRKWIASPNYSSRGGAGVRLIVVHTAEGALTIESLGNFFASSSAGVSSHTGADDKKGVIGEYVKRGNKAWTQGNANPYCVSIELCAFAKWSTSEWNKHPNMLDNCARWIAEEAKAYGIPITKLSPSQVTSGRGVCQHADLGAYGNDHWDCGGGFPIDKVLDMARGGGQEEEVLFVQPPPDWYYPWLDWYVNSKPREQSNKPKGVPEKIPQWAWDAEEAFLKTAKRYGMTDKEREWMNWYIDTPRDEKTKPDKVPSPIPDRWWDDERFVLNQQAKFGRPT